MGIGVPLKGGKVLELLKEYYLFKNVSDPGNS
jgi:hypothetical protein